MGAASELSEELKELVIQYKTTFGHSFPMWQTGLGIPGCIGLIKECLEKGMSVYDMGVVEDTEDGGIVY